MALNKMAALQLSQLNIANADELLKRVKNGWFHKSGRYVALQLDMDAFVEADAGATYGSVRMYYIYARDDRGILGRVPIDLECAENADAFILIELEKLFDSQPLTPDLTAELTTLKQRSSKPKGFDGRSQITLPGYAQHKTKDKP